MVNGVITCLHCKYMWLPENDDDADAKNLKHGVQKGFKPWIYLIPALWLLALWNSKSDSVIKDHRQVVIENDLEC